MKILRYGQRYQKISSGFTLLELLISVFIATLVLVMVSTSFLQIIEAKDKVENELELLHESRVIFARLNRDLFNIFPRGRVKRGVNYHHYSYFLGTMDENDNSTLRFSAVSRSPIHFNRESDQSEITYFLERSNEEKGLYVLKRRDNPWFGNPNGGTEYEISDRVVKFQVSYITQEIFNQIQANQIQPELIEEWNPDTLGTDILPLAVDIGLVLRNEDNEDISFNTTISIPIVN